MIVSNGAANAKLSKSQRSGTQSSVAAAAYRSGERLVDDRTKLVHDYSRKRGVIFREIFVPPSAPAWSRNRQSLWSKAEQTEVRKNSTVAREFLCALPAELTETERLTLIRSFCEELVARHHFAVDVSIHKPDKKVLDSEGNDISNHHAHVLTTTRRIVGADFGSKCRELDDVKSGEVKFWRERWEACVNEALQKAGHGDKLVDSRSYADRGSDEVPTIKVGRHSASNERKAYNLEVRRLNKEIRLLQEERAVVLAIEQGREQERLIRIEQLKSDLAVRKGRAAAMTDAEIDKALGIPARPTLPRQQGQELSTPYVFAPSPIDNEEFAINLNGATMDLVSLRNTLQIAIADAKLPQDLQVLLSRSGIATQFIRGGKLNEIEALNLRDPDRPEWLLTDDLGPDLSWTMISTRKGWMPIVAKGLLSGCVSTVPKSVRPPNDMETELDLLAEHINTIQQALRLLIVKLINFLLSTAERIFGASLPRLNETPVGVQRSAPQASQYSAPSQDCIRKTADHLRSLRMAIQERDLDRLALPQQMPHLAEVREGLRNLKIEESKSPEQRQIERNAALQGDLERSRKHLAACRREASDLKSSLYQYSGKLKFASKAEHSKAIQLAERKLEEAERRYDALLGQLPCESHDRNDDAASYQIEHERQ